MGGRLSCFHAVLGMRLTSELILSTKYRPINVGPELFNQIEHAVQAYLRSPPLVCFHPRVGLRRVIQIADARGPSSSHDLRQIESALARVRPCDEQPAERITGSLGEAAFAHGVVSRIFSRHLWD